MEYYCEVCDNYIKAKSKYKHFESNIHEEINKSKHILLSLRDININDIDKTFYLYIIQHNKKFNFLCREMSF